MERTTATTTTTKVTQINIQSERNQPFGLSLSSTFVLAASIEKPVRLCKIKTISSHFAM